MSPDNRTIPELLSDTLTQFSRLLRSEIRLARAEVSEKVSVAVNGVGFIVAGALFVGPGIILVLTAFAVLLIEYGTRPSLAYLIAGVVGLAIAGVLVSIGLKRLKNVDMVPDRALNQINRDVAAVRQQV